MDWLGIDVAELLGPDLSVPETLLRGTIMYFVIFGLLRVVLRGRTGGTTMSDLLVLVLIADAAQNAMADDYTSLASGTCWWRRSSAGASPLTGSPTGSRASDGSSIRRRRSWSRTGVSSGPPYAAR